jgi:lipoprotein NlpI
MRAALIATFLAVSIDASLATAADTPPAAASRTAAPEPPPAATSRTAAPESSPAAASRAAAPESPPAAPNSAHNSPLVAYALELGQSNSGTQEKALYVATTSLRAITYEMSRHPPPSDKECAHTLGASRFAEQYARLGTIHDQLGEFEAVIQANESALACQPRVASYQASIASAHLTLGHIEEARAAAERGYAIDPEDDDIHDMRARLDFIQERWADATARFRLQVVDERYAGAVFGDYARCYLWLAQRRAGMREPELPKREQDPKDTETPERKRWPAQILDALRGELSEEDLVQAIRDRDDGEEREWLTEALFYVGELRLAQGDAETARRHFASVVNLRVLNFVEYGMARAELGKMRALAEAATQAR